MSSEKKDFVTFSKKQMQVLTWWCKNSPNASYDALICDGAVRSGKTLCMSISFISWAFYNFDETAFALCGKTIQSLRRNVVTPMIPILERLGFSCTEKLSRNYIEIAFKKRVNKIYLFGGKDESSASLIQGMTLGGVLFDEVALMPRSFVEQALARCSLDGSKFWFNCNPENPHHWFHEEWICKLKIKNALYIHFTMKDNPSLDKKVIERYQTLYSGAFFERFILGKWVATDGLIYPMFSREKNVCKNISDDMAEYYVSCDYGTVNPASFGLWGRKENTWYRINEYYHDSRKRGFQQTDEEYYQNLKGLIGKRKITCVIVDPSASSFIECIKRHGEYEVVCAKNEVLKGIQKVSQALIDKKIYFCENCVDSLREFEMYRWEQGNIKDCPKKENDHAMDDIRYFVTMLDEKTQSDFFAIVAHR